MNSKNEDIRFNMLKKHHTNTLYEAIDQKKVDLLVIDFLKQVVDIKDIYTSSSCSGRIMLLETNELEDKKISHFHKKFHRTVTIDEVYKELEKKSENEIWLKVEPFIIHFGCRNYDVAKEILNFSKQFGLKRAGIITAKDGKHVVEANNTQYMSLLVKIKDKILIDKEYLELIIKRANKKLELNFKKLKEYEDSFLDYFLSK